MEDKQSKQNFQNGKPKRCAEILPEILSKSVGNSLELSTKSLSNEFIKSPETPLEMPSISVENFLLNKDLTFSSNDDCIKKCSKQTISSGVLVTCVPEPLEKFPALNPPCQTCPGTSKNELLSGELRISSKRESTDVLNDHTFWENNNNGEDSSPKVEQRTNIYNCNKYKEDSSIKGNIFYKFKFHKGGSG